MTAKHTSAGVYILVWLGLLLLTLLSFLLSRADLGAVDTVLSLLIAGAKSVLVGLFFMHLIEERLRTAFVPIVSTGFVILLISLVVTDVLTRHTFPKAPSPVEVPEEIRALERGPDPER
jgi:cytochrome c oxidase subunit IV